MTASTAQASGGIALTLLFALAVSALAQPAPAPSPDMLTSGTLTIWTSCRVNAESTARFEADALHRDYPNLNVQTKALTPSEFLPAYAALGAGDQRPDIVFADNLVQKSPLLAAGAVQIVGQPRQRTCGRGLIPDSAPHPELARALVLWMEQAPKGPLPHFKTQLLRSGDKTQIRSAAIAAVEGFYVTHRPPEGVLDAAIAKFTWDQFLGPTAGHQQSLNATVDLVGGSQRLAFAEVSSPEAIDHFFGLHHSTILLRKVDTVWRVLLIEPDDSYTHALQMMKSLDDLQLGDLSQDSKSYLFPLAPADHAQIPRLPAPELDIEQQGEPGILLAIESQVSAPDGKWWGSTILTLLPEETKADHIVRVAAPFGVGQQPHRWRAWSIDRSGNVTLSEWRTIDFTT